MLLADKILYIEEGKKEEPKKHLRFVTKNEKIKMKNVILEK